MCNCNKTQPSGKQKPSSASVNTASKNLHNPKGIPSRQVKTHKSEPEIELLSGDTFEDKLAAFAELLGVKNDLPENVLLAAMEDAIYARKLLVNIGNTNQLNDLINHPPEISSANLPSSNPSFTNSELIAKAGKALFKWGFAGFSTVSEEILQRRENACLGCKNLVAPSRMIQRLSASSTISTEIGKRTGNKTCSACGCVVKNKMRLATDTCPVENPEIPGLNLWGEVIPK